MSLEPPLLDDLRWEQLVDAARRRIAAASGGRWTLHAPVDPGVTLLELYAWLHEQRLFWMDQRTPAIDRRLLALLGVMPRAEVPAATVLQLIEGPSVAAGDIFELADGLSSVVWTAEEGIDRLDLDPGAPRVELEIDGVDHSADLGRRAVRLLPFSGPGAVTVRLWLRSPPRAGGVMAFLVQLYEASMVHPDLALGDAPPGITPPPAPGWAPSPADDQLPGEPTPSVRAPTPLRWRYDAGAAFAPLEVLEDRTGGLRRSGTLRVRIPADWRPDRQVAAGAAAPYALRLEVAAAAHTAPPRLLGWVPNVVRARDREARTARAALDWLPLGGGRLPLPEAAGRLRIHADTFAVTLHESTGARRWAPVDDLAVAAPEAPVFVADRRDGCLRFGDGLTGRQPRPAPGGENVVVHFETGGGPAGDLPAGATWRRRGGAAKAINVVPGVGGAEPETLAEARVRARRQLDRRERAVTLADYRHIALSTPGVALHRAWAVAGLHPDHPCHTRTPGAVSVFVVPAAPRDQLADEWHAHADVPAPRLDSGAMEAIQRRLDQRRVVGTRAFVRQPLYRLVELGFELRADPGDAAALRAALAARMRAWTDPLTGGPTGQGWPFGEPLIQSTFIEQAVAALGDRADVDGVAITLADAPPSRRRAERCDPVSVEPYALVHVAAVTAVIRPRTRRPGGLR